MVKLELEAPQLEHPAEQEQVSVHGPVYPRPLLEAARWLVRRTLERCLKEEEAQARARA